MPQTSTASAPLLEHDGSRRTETFPLVPSPEPVSLGISPLRVRSGAPLLRHKTTRRRIYEDAGAACPDCDDVILLNERGEITETTIANIVLDMGGKLITPTLECGLLPGVCRQALLDDGTISEATVTPDMLSAAREIWLINSVRKWRRAVLCDPDSARLPAASNG